jgi:large subunit ribosomal protein L24
MVKRHTRPQQSPSASSATAAQLGGVIEREGPIHISNVMLLDPKGQPTRVRIERENGVRFRVAKTTGARLD